MDFTASKPLHICVGSVDDLNYFREGVDSGEPISWIVPKAAKPGDPVLFLLPSRIGAFEGCGIVMEETTKSPNGHNIYRSMVGHLEILPEAVPIEIVQDSLPDWKYLTYARAKITVPVQFVGTLIKVIEEYQSEEQDNIDDDAVFNPKNLADAREQILILTGIRRGQPKFRETLLKIYEGKCAVTGYTASYALEAAHIIPYKGTDFHHPANGLLLRADIHTLFDLHFLCVDTNSMTVLLSPDLEGTSYDYLAGKSLFLPKDEKFRPNKEALDMHRKEAGL